MAIKGILELSKEKIIELQNSQFTAAMLKSFLAYYKLSADEDPLSDDNFLSIYPAAVEIYDYVTYKIMKAANISELSVRRLILYVIDSVFEGAPPALDFVTQHCACDDFYLYDECEAAEYIKEHFKECEALQTACKIHYNRRINAEKSLMNASCLCDVVQLPRELTAMLNNMQYVKIMNPNEKGKAFNCVDLMKIAYVYGVRAERARRRREEIPHF